MATETTTPRWRRPAGHALNIELLRYKIAQTGMTHAELCVRAGISEMTLSAALGGRPVKQRTLAKLAKALAELPIVVGAELLAEPGGQA